MRKTYLPWTNVGRRFPDSERMYARSTAWSRLQGVPKNKHGERRLVGLLTLGWLYQPSVDPSRQARIGAVLATLLHMPRVELDRSIAAVCVGDGDLPWLAVAISRMTHWTTYAVDPGLNPRLMSAPGKLTLVRMPAEQVVIREKRIIIFAEHAHVRVSDMVGMVPKGSKLLAIVHLPCCKRWDWSRRSLSYNELLLSGKRQLVNLWLCPEWAKQRKDTVRKQERERRARLRRMRLAMRSKGTRVRLAGKRRG